MGYQLELGGILLPPGSCHGPKSGFSRCIPRELPWCSPIEWLTWVDLILSGILSCVLGLGAPWNPPLWAGKVLIGHNNQNPRLVTW